MTSQNKPESTEQNGTETLSGVDAILKERGSTYGDSGINLECMADLLDAFEKGAQRAAGWRQTNGMNPYSPQNQMPSARAHHMAITMIMGKLARIATGGINHADNYDDIIGYAKIAKKHATGEDYQ